MKNNTINSSDVGLLHAPVTRPSQPCRQKSDNLHTASCGFNVEALRRENAQESLPLTE